MGAGPVPRSHLKEEAVQIKFLKAYRGWDGAGELVQEAGSVATVSDAKGAQLLEDFPDDVEVVKPVPAGKGK